MQIMHIIEMNNEMHVWQRRHLGFIFFLKVEEVQDEHIQKMKDSIKFPELL